MGLAEKLTARKCGKAHCEVDGEKFEILELSRRERSELQAKCRSKSSGMLDSERLESELLVRCVCDPATSEPVFGSYKQWDDVPAMITGPLIAAVMKANGFDEADLGKPEQDDTAET